MPCYWSKRHSYAVTQAETAQSVELKEIYLQLAAYYLSLQRITETSAGKPS